MTKFSCFSTKKVYNGHCNKIMISIIEKKIKLIENFFYVSYFVNLIASINI